jgi:transposase
MKRFVAGADRTQSTLLPECLDDFIVESNPVRVVDAFVAALDLVELGFDGVEPAATGRPAYHPSTLLKLYIYGYLNRVQSSRRLEREAGRNLEVMWLLGRLVPDHKTIADFRKDNGPAIRKVCAPHRWPSRSGPAASVQWGYRSHRPIGSGTVVK